MKGSKGESNGRAMADRLGGEMTTQKMTIRGLAAGLGLLIASSGVSFAQMRAERCGAGWCTATVIGYTPLTNQSTGALVYDMGQQFPSLTLVAGALSGAVPISITKYSPFLNKTSGGANFQLQWTGALPAGQPYAWIQIIDSNYNAAGYSDDGGYHTVQPGPNTLQQNVDVKIGSTSPNYNPKNSSDSQATNYPVGSYTPPYFTDSPGRLLPTASNPVINWTAQVFLTVDDTANKLVTVYGGEKWGWSMRYSPAPITVNTTTYTLSDATMSGWPFAGAIASGTYGVESYSTGENILFGNITVVENVQGTDHTYNFNYDCDPVLTSGCGVLQTPSQFDSNFYASLNIDSYALNGDSSVVPVSFSDFVYIASGSGTLSQVTTTADVPVDDQETGPTDWDAVDGGPTSAAPEPSTWVMVAAGFACLGAMASRRKRQLKLA
jgi:hypothetical protein